jgi:hypothetical protein
VRERLKPGGFAGIQVITIEESLFGRYRRELDFIRRYVFPGGMLPTGSIMRDLGSRVGLSVSNERVFGRDYALTLVHWRERFRVRRDLAVAALNAVPGLTTPVPDGAFYCLVDAAQLMARFGDDEALALHLLDSGVAVVAASAFGGQEGFRISFAADDARLAEALSRIAKALQ